MQVTLRAVPNFPTSPSPPGSAAHTTLYSVQITVSDRGPGMPADERERIFEPFYRSSYASEAHGGVGLGLALVKSIAHRHGGNVLCQSRSGGGASFVESLAGLST